MNVKISVFVICVEVITYLLLYNLHGCTFKGPSAKMSFLSHPDIPLAVNHTTLHLSPVIQKDKK